MKTIFHAHWATEEEWACIYIYQKGQRFRYHSFGCHMLAGGDYGHEQSISESEALEIMLEHEDVECWDDDCEW